MDLPQEAQKGFVPLVAKTTSVENDTNTDTEVVQRTLVGCGSGCSRYSHRTKIGKVESHRIVIDLKNAEVDAVTQTNIESATDRSRKTSIVEVEEIIIKL